MSEPSPRSHIYRLGIVLAAGFLVSLMLMKLSEPANWNSRDWYRSDALEELKELPLIYGGNEACAVCHEEKIEVVKTFRHRTLSCESCHGPLANHVEGKQKIADAYVEDEGSWQCLNCHKELVSKARDFPQFSRERTREHILIKPGAPCTSCHNAHDPTA